MSIDTLVQQMFLSVQSDTVTKIFAVISASVYVLIAMPAIYFIYKRRNKDLLKYFISVVVLGLITEILKIATDRMRPDLSDNESFPSRHAMLAFFAAYFLPTEKKTKILFYIWAILIAVSRLALNLHWFTDVLAGGAIGWLAGFVVERVTRKKLLCNFSLKIEKILKSLKRK